MRKRSKNYTQALALIEKNHAYDLASGIELLKKTSVSKFDASVEVVFRLGVDPRHADQQIRGAMVLPHGTGKDRKVLVITQGDKVEAAKNAGADFVGGKEMIEKIQKENWFEYDVIVASPDMMAELGKIGRILGPKKLMPNPKTGTVTPDVAKAVQEVKAGKVEYRVDSEGNLHVLVGKVSFDNSKLIDNLKALHETVVKAKPAAVKGTYIKNISISSTMGPGIKVNSETF